MYCCGPCRGHRHGHSRRHFVWCGLTTSLGVLLNGGLSPRGSTAAAQTAETASAALEVLRNERRLGEELRWSRVDNCELLSRLCSLRGSTLSACWSEKSILDGTLDAAAGREGEVIRL